MPDFYDYRNEIRSAKSREKARIRRRRRLIKQTALFGVILIVAVLSITHLLNNGKNKPSDTAVKSTATPAIKTPSITPEQFQINSSPTPLATVPAATVPPVSVPPVTSAPVSASSMGTATKTASSYKIKVSNAKQTVTVYDSSNQVVKSFVCSTGLDGADTETPVGTYTVAERGESFFSQTYQQGAYYWTQFYGDYLFHSVPFDKNRQIETAEAAKLGTKASHGCVRLTIENAKWIYDNIPRGTTVVIE